MQTTISQIYENELLKPAKDMAGLYAIVESSIGSRDALLLPSLGKSREAFTASLLAANAFYLSLSSDSADEARANISTVEQTIPVMIDLAENSLQRSALAALAQRATSFRDGLKSLGEQFAARANLLKTAIDDNQAAMIQVINKLSAQMNLRELRAQGSFDHTLANLYQNVALVAIVRFRDGKLAHEHIYWDQASVLKQLGLLTGPGLPVFGVESADKVRGCA